MEIIDSGPNRGIRFPSNRSIENFDYDGFSVTSLKGFASYEVEEFIEWTDDPGIGRFKCSDGETRIIPSCQLERSYYDSLPKRPKLNPFKGLGVFFGTPSKS